jgi:hypothetical protein
MAEFIWRCMLRMQLQKGLAVMLGVMSVAILLAEATLLPSGVDLSLFSNLVNAVGRQEVLVQVLSMIGCFHYSSKVGEGIVYWLSLIFLCLCM